jgi:hypothetical protein
MALVNVWVANPTLVDITQGAFTAKANTVTKISIDNANATDAFGLLAAGCALVSDSATTNFSQKSRTGFLIERELVRQ